MKNRRGNPKAVVIMDSAQLSVKHRAIPLEMPVPEKEGIEGFVEFLLEHRSEFESTKEGIISKARKDSIERERIEEKVIKAFSEIPREVFVHPTIQAFSYFDHPLPVVPLKYGQSIPKPSYIVHVLNLLDVNPSDKVLHLYVASGYTTALLSRLAHRVIGVERIQELAEDARERIRKIGINNVVIHTTNEIGCSNEAPYDKILVTSTAPVIPKGLFAQLKEGGTMVIPIVQDKDARLEDFEKEPPPLQGLYEVRKENGEVETEFEEFCRFRPLRYGKFE